MSDRTLSASQISLLEKGLSFIPTVCKTSYKDIVDCKLRNIRNLKLRDFFRFSDRTYDPNAFEHKFVGRSRWIPPTEGLSEETINSLKVISSQSQLVFKNRFIRDSRFGETFIACRDNSKLNLSPDELLSLNQLRDDKHIIIKPADKGGAVVIMEKNLYREEGLRQLLNPFYYEEIERPLANETIELINNVYFKLLNRGFLNDRQYDFLCAKSPISQRSFYLLPKIHKPLFKWPNRRMPEGRPIVSDCGSETYTACQFIDYFLKPLAINHASYLKDTYDFVFKIRNRSIPPNSLLVTGDVTALYTNMNIDRSIQVVREAFLRHPDSTRPDDEIIELLDICLRRNDFFFAGKTFLQKCGTAMGKTFAPNLANLYLLHLDWCAVNGFSIKPLLFYRYLDDIFFVWPGSRDDLQAFNLYLNSILPGIKITFTVREETIEFLDTRVYKSHNSGGTILQTRVYFKPTDTHQLLHASSFHPRHTIRGIMKSQIIRFKRLCSNKTEFDYACRTLFNVLRFRGYSRSTFRRLKREIWFLQLPIKSHSKLVNSHQIFPIVNFYDRIGSKLMRIFYTSTKNLKLFDKTRVVQANKIHKNLSRLIIRSRFEF